MTRGLHYMFPRTNYAKLSIIFPCLSPTQPAFFFPFNISSKSKCIVCCRIQSEPWNLGLDVDIYTKMFFCPTSFSLVKWFSKFHSVFFFFVWTSFPLNLHLPFNIHSSYTKSFFYCVFSFFSFFCFLFRHFKKNIPFAFKFLEIFFLHLLVLIFTNISVICFYFSFDFVYFIFLY